MLVCGESCDERSKPEKSSSKLNSTKPFRWMLTPLSRIHIKNGNNNDDCYCHIAFAEMAETKHDATIHANRITNHIPLLQLLILSRSHAVMFGVCEKYRCVFLPHHTHTKRIATWKWNEMRKKISWKNREEGKSPLYGATVDWILNFDSFCFHSVDAFEFLRFDCAIL